MIEAASSLDLAFFSTHLIITLAIQRELVDEYYNINRIWRMFKLIMWWFLLCFLYSATYKVYLTACQVFKFDLRVLGAKFQVFRCV